MSTAEPAITLLIVDDHAFVRQAFVTLLSLDNRLQVLGDCGELDEAHSENLRLCPQVILLDFQLAEGHCLQAIQRLRQTPHQPRVLVLSSFAAGVNVFAAMQAGAAGYLLKSNPASLVVAGILRVASGRSAFAPELGDLRIQPSSPIALTASELRILELLAQGHSNDVIAGQLGIMVSTVKTHVHHILDKLGARSRTEARARAQLAGWADRRGVEASRRDLRRMACRCQVGCARRVGAANRSLPLASAATRMGSTRWPAFKYCECARADERWLFVDRHASRACPF